MIYVLLLLIWLCIFLWYKSVQGFKLDNYKCNTFVYEKILAKKRELVNNLYSDKLNLK
jgi:hypothetical protein